MHTYFLARRSGAEGALGLAGGGSAVLAYVAQRRAAHAGGRRVGLGGSLGCFGDAERSFLLHPSPSYLCRHHLPLKRDHSGVWARVTQINGLPLLCLLAAHLLVFVVLSGLVYGVVGRVLEALCGCKLLACDDEGGRGGGGVGGGGACGAHGALFDAALLGAGGFRLDGAPTYRMPRHPAYRDLFATPM